MSDELSDAISGGLESVTKKWAKQRKAEERAASARLRRHQSMTSMRGPTIADAAYQVMRAAYLKASGNGRFFANARQIMYAARPLVLEITGGKCWSDDSYFTQQLLPDYVQEHGLDSEPWSEKVSQDAATQTLRRHGATDDEIDFLIEGGDPWGPRTWGRRVELNALTSDQFIEWLEAKLDEHGVEKVIPDADTLALQYRRALARHTINKKIDEIAESAREEAGQTVIPADLAARIRDLLADDAAMSWDEAVAQLAANGVDRAVTS